MNKPGATGSWAQRRAFDSVRNFSRPPSVLDDSTISATLSLLPRADGCGPVPDEERAGENQEHLREIPTEDIHAAVPRDTARRLPHCPLPVNDRVEAEFISRSRLKLSTVLRIWSSFRCTSIKRRSAQRYRVIGGPFIARVAASLAWTAAVAMSPTRMGSMWLFVLMMRAVENCSPTRVSSIVPFGLSRGNAEVAERRSTSSSGDVHLGDA